MCLTGTCCNTTACFSLSTDQFCPVCVVSETRTNWGKVVKWGQDASEPVSDFTWPGSQKAILMQRILTETTKSNKKWKRFRSRQGFIAHTAQTPPLQVIQVLELFLLPLVLFAFPSPATAICSWPSYSPSAIPSSVCSTLMPAVKAGTSLKLLLRILTLCLWISEELGSSAHKDHNQLGEVGLPMDSTFTTPG